MAFSEDSRDEIQTIGKLIVYKNALIFEDTAYQISNICSIWVADHSYEIKHEFPKWIIIFGIVGVLLILFGAESSQYIGVIVGIILCGIAFYGYKNYTDKTSVFKYAVGIELTSGRRTLFTSPDEKFVQKAAKSLLGSIVEKRTSAEKLVMNFDNKSINIEKAEGSNIIGGNVSDSLVENV